MTPFQRLLLTSALAAITFATGCSKPAGETSSALASGPSAGRPSAVDPALIARAQAQISQKAWLDERLPEHTVGYVRIPSVWGVASAPDGRPLDAALASDQHTRIIAALRKAAQTDPTLAQSQAGPVLQLLLGDQAAPIEAAVIDVSDGVSPFSTVLITTVLDVQDVAALNARIAAMSAGGQSPLQAPVDANGDASLQKFGALHFDAATHRLYLVVGTTASALVLAQDLAQLTNKHSHPMQDAEHEIDQSGEGLFAWMSMKGLNTQMEAKLVDEPPDGLRRDLLEHLQSVALGWGTVDGHGRLQLQVLAPQSRLLGYLAPKAGEVDLKSSGKPDWAITMAVPGSDNLQAIHDNLDRDFGDGLRAQVDPALTRIQATTGIDPIAFDRLFGAQLVMFEDANGQFAAMRIPDRKALYAKLDEFSQRLGWKHSVLKVGDAQIHHLRIPSHDSSNDVVGADPKTLATLHLVARAGEHLYWTEEGDYLVFAKVPQPLMDRVASKPDTSLGAWLHDRQSYDAAHTLLGYTGTTRDLQRTVYYTYLSALQLAGDLLGQPVDLTTMPSGGQLKLPVEGVAGLAVLADDRRLSLRMTYEQSPAEMALGGNGTLTTVAVIGVLAAIAVPAYQDYVIRSQFSEGALLADGAKTAVAQYYSQNGRMPHDNAQAGLAAPGSISGAYASSITVADGRIIIAYEGAQANAQLRGKVLVFAPNPDQGSIRWTCDTAAGTTIDVKYRAVVCRP